MVLKVPLVVGYCAGLLLGLPHSVGPRIYHGSIYIYYILYGRYIYIIYGGYI